MVHFKKQIYSILKHHNKLKICYILYPCNILNKIKYKYKLIKHLIVFFLITIKWEEFIFIIYTGIICLTIKKYINSIIYSSIPSWVPAFMLALLCSWFISKLGKKLFKALFKSTRSYHYILNTYVILSLIRLVINYFPSIYPSLACVHPLCFMGPKSEEENSWINRNGIVKVASNLTPEQIAFIGRQAMREADGGVALNRFGHAYASPRTNRIVYEMAFPEARLYRTGQDIYHRVKRLEPVVSAIGRDGSNTRHGAFLDIFSEHINSSKEELNRVRKELLPDTVSHWDRLLD